MLDLAYDITRLRPADYNPRRIENKDIEALAASIRELGLVKPLIARGEMLVAGHQRSRALRSLGIEQAPVYLLPRETTTYDEVRFNQLHNGTDLDSGDEDCRIVEPLSVGYQVVEAARVAGNFRARMANVRAQICRLILAYGPWGGVVATRSGKVIHCAQYALAAAMTKTPLTVFGVEDHEEEKYRARLSRTYGAFSYEHLPKDTYIQTFAQLYRLREGPSGNQRRSSLYESMVMPWLAEHPGARALDFGSGQGDYARALRQQGKDVLDLEFFRRTPGANRIDVRAVNAMIDAALGRVRQGQLFDVVVCDSVLNSVDCYKAEASVMALLNGFCRTGGTVFFSGRKLEAAQDLHRLTRQVGKKRFVEFLDDAGYSGLYRNGRWFYQKYHSGEQVEDLACRFDFEVISHQRGVSSNSWHVHAVKRRGLPFAELAEAIAYEFDLPLSDDRRLGRAEDALAAFREMNGCS